MGLRNIHKPRAVVDLEANGKGFNPGDRMNARQAKKVCRRAHRGPKSKAYFSNIKPTTYSKALDWACRCIILRHRQKRIEVAE
jgi:hypothetical protein